MERRVGEIFTYKDKTYKILKAIDGCKGCAFYSQSCAGITKNEHCSSSNRADEISVIFKEINNMEIKNNQLTIDIPKGIEIDIVNSDLAKGIVKFKQSTITYEDVLKLCIHHKDIIINESNFSKLANLNKLMNIAKYYNEDWKPDWNNRGENKYFIIWNNECKTYWTDYNRNSGLSVVYFKNKEDAQSVIDNPNFREILDAIYKY